MFRVTYVLREWLYCGLARRYRLDKSFQVRVLTGKPSVMGLSLQHRAINVSRTVNAPTNSAAYHR
jgi:hypothetical protein